MRPRNSQMSKVYSAIYDAGLSSGELLETPDAVNFLQAIFNDKYFKGQWPDKKILKVSSAGHFKCYGKPIDDGVEIRLPRRQSRKSTALCMLAYGLIPKDAAWNGWEYADTLLKLVDRYLSISTAQRLKEAFIKHKVRFKPKRKRTLTEEQKEILKKRLIIARTVRKVRQRLQV